MNQTLVNLINAFPKKISEETIIVRVVEYEGGHRAYFVSSQPHMPSARLDDLLQDLHLKRNHINKGIT